MQTDFFRAPDDDPGSSDGRDLNVTWDAISAIGDREAVVDPRLRLGPRVNASDLDIDPQLTDAVAGEEQLTEFEMLLHFLPIRWITSTMIPAMNACARAGIGGGGAFREITWADLQIILGILMYHTGTCMETFDNLWAHEVDPFWRQRRHGIVRYMSRDRARLVSASVCV